MKSLKDILIEAKNDNLHEFIQYLNDHGKDGELHSSCSEAHLYDKFMIDCDIHNSPLYNEIINSESAIGSYCYDREIEEDEIVWDEETYRDFDEWCLDTATDVILEYIKTNNKNCIYIERAIVVPYFTNKDKLYRWFKTDYGGHLGVCWAYRKGRAEAYFGGFEKGDTIILKGYVRPEDVNWTETVALCLYNIDEYELRLNDNAPIQLTEIVTEKGNHKIFNGNLILPA